MEGELTMSNQQKLDKFWAKLAKAGAEIQHDFAELDPQDKQIVTGRINSLLKMKGISVGVESLLGALGGLRR